MGEWDDDGINDVRAYWLGRIEHVPLNALPFDVWCGLHGVRQPKFREYEPTDEDKRILSELGIEA